MRATTFCIHLTHTFLYARAMTIQSWAFSSWAHHFQLMEYNYRQTLVGNLRLAFILFEKKVVDHATIVGHRICLFVWTGVHQVYRQTTSLWAEFLCLALLVCRSVSLSKKCQKCKKRGIQPKSVNLNCFNVGIDLETFLYLYLFICRSVSLFFNRGQDDSIARLVSLSYGHPNALILDNTA